MNIDHETSMRVGIVKVELYFPHSHSLKEKRHALRKIKDRIFARYKIAMQEVSHHDKWQRAQLGFAIVSHDGSYVHSIIDKILNEIDRLAVGERIDEIIEILSF